MSASIPVLELAYSDAEAFRHDYEADLSNGGVFVPTSQRLELRGRVTVRLRLDWCQRAVDLPGEVVHVVPSEMTELGGKPGVAVQFSASAYEVRDQLAPLTFEPAGDPAQAGDTRVAPRKAARVAARVDWNGGQVLGCTRNLSRTGVLVGIQDGTVPAGESVTVTLRHPGSGSEFEVRGRVARQVKSEGRVTALGIQFRSDPDSRRTVGRLIDEVMGSEHTRRLGAISGPIAELGPHSIVQMLATGASRGTIVLRHGEEEGLICFENGLLNLVRLGSLQGMKALVRILSWRQGTFEFTTGIEEEGRDAPLPLEAAVLDAVRQLDEAATAASSSFPLQARLVRAKGAPEREDEHSTVEEALLDLAKAGFTVSRALEVIPESDVEIFRAMRALIEAKELELH